MTIDKIYKEFYKITSLGVAMDSLGSPWSSLGKLWGLIGVSLKCAWESQGVLEGSLGYW